MQAHNVGSNHPRLSHQQFVIFLEECSKRWRALGDDEQARLVLKASDRARKQGEPGCRVCQYAAQQEAS